jgi:uncharacterized cupin superfamily protein
MPKIEIAAAVVRSGSNYPAPYHEPCLNKTRRKLGDVPGLSQFGVSLLTLQPGAWSSQRHWHTAEDEFVWVVSGEVVLVTDEGEHMLKAGDCAGFPAGQANGHHLQNRAAVPAALLEVGSRRPGVDVTDYPDIDMTSSARGRFHRDGTPYPAQLRR